MQNVLLTLKPKECDHSCRTDRGVTQLIRSLYEPKKLGKGDRSSGLGFVRQPHFLERIQCRNDFRLIATRDVPGPLTDSHGQYGGAHARSAVRTLFDLREKPVG